MIRVNPSLLDSQMSDTVHFGYSGHLGPPRSGHYIRMATIPDLNIKEQMNFVPGKVATISEWPL